MQYFANVMFNFQDSIEAFNGHACYDNSTGNMIIHFRPLQRFLSEKCFHPRLSDFCGSQQYGRSMYLFNDIAIQQFFAIIPPIIAFFLITQRMVELNYNRFVPAAGAVFRVVFKKETHINSWVCHSCKCLTRVFEAYFHNFALSHPSALGAEAIEYL